MRLGNPAARITQGDDYSQVEKGATVDKDSCENVGLSLAWIACPIINAADYALNWIDTQVQSLLFINNKAYSSDNMYHAWTTIRNIAYIILIPMMLVMVIGTALGFEFFNAYTIKRALPRMVVAVIFITFSWYITTFLINLFNVIGSGVLGLLTAPFSAAYGSFSTLTLGDVFTVGNNNEFWSSILAEGALAVGIVIILAFYLPAVALLAFTALGLLLFRQLLIIALMLVAPLAILAWIFPGNDRFWKLWWNTFTKLLLLYPILMAVIAVGRILAVLIADDENRLFSGVLQPILVIAAFILPYAMIPFAFKLAGGLFASLTGMVNDRSKGLYDRTKQGRADKMSRTKNGNFFRGAPKGSVRGKINTGLGFGTNVGKTGLKPWQAKTRVGAYLSNSMYDEQLEAAEKNSDVRSITANDDYLEAGRRVKGGFVTDSNGNKIAPRDGSERAVRAFLSQKGYNEQSIQQVMRAKKAMSADAFDVMAATRLAGTGTGYGGGISELYSAINDAAGDDRHLASRMLADSRGIAERARRPDLVASGFGQSNTLMNDLHTGKFSQDYEDKVSGKVLASKGDAVTPDLVQKIQDISTLRTQDPRMLMGMKAKQLKDRMAPLMTEMVQDELTATTTPDGVTGKQKITRELASIASKLDSSSGATPEQAAALTSTLAAELDVNQMSPEVRQALDAAITTYTRDASGQRVAVSQKTKITVQQALESVRGDEDFTRWRREYGTGREAAASGAFVVPEPPENA